MQRSAPVLPAIGGLFGVFCPACVPALAVFLPTVGLGFLADLIVSRTILLALLGIALLALHMSALAHRRHFPFVLGLAAALAMIAARNVILQPWLVDVAAAGLIAAGALDWWYRRTGTVAMCPVPHGDRIRESDAS